MGLWLAIALMTASAIFAVLWPLARRSSEPRSGSDVVVYRDQLEEIERDRLAGLIADKEADAARVEVSRRLIAAADAQPPVEGAAPASTTWRRRAVAIVAIVVMPLTASAVYLLLGSPSLPDQPLAARLITGGGDPSVGALIARVESHLERNPDDGRGWEVIAPVYLRLARFDDAVRARRNALRLNEPTSAREAALGEALVFAANGVVTAEAKTAFERALALDGENVPARYFLGLAAEQDGNRAQAAAIWRALIASAASDAAWVHGVRQALARVEDRGTAVGPTEEQIAGAAELGVEQRSTMISAMVERLAERLRSDGSDLAGWQRLVRSYVVLGQPENARAAVLDARRALAGDAGKLRQLDDFVKALGLDG